MLNSLDRKKRVIKPAIAVHAQAIRFNIRCLPCFEIMRPLTNENIEAELSYAYLHAVALREQGLAARSLVVTTITRGWMLS